MNVQKHLQVRAQDIIHLNSPVISFLGGNEQALAHKVSSPEDGQVGHLVFLAKADQMPRALEKNISMIVAAFDAKPFVDQLKKDQALFQTPQINLGMSWILPLFDSKKDRFQWGQEIHPTAFVDSSAEIGPGVRIGPGAFVGAGTKIGARTLIGANTIVENNCQIGDDCILHPLAFIGADTIMGARCEIHPQVTLGADGFGFAQDKTKVPKKIPQLGRVVLGDDVEIGANTTVDRATLTETKIHSNTKLDKHCHVAHNCEIGPNSLIAGGFFVAGSSKIGANFMVGGTSVVTDHVSICDNVILAGRAVVTKDIEKPGAYGGYPLEPLKESLRTISNLAHLTKMRKQLHAIMSKLGLSDEA